MLQEEAQWRSHSGTVIGIGIKRAPHLDVALFLGDLLILFHEYQGSKLTVASSKFAT